ncbi:hypothetical protein D9M69_659490 [compost metagenome]
MALLVDGKVEVRRQGRQLIDIVLQADREAQGMGLAGQEAVVVELRAGIQREPRTVGVGVHVVGFHPVASLGGGQFQPGFHDRAHVG